MTEERKQVLDIERILAEADRCYERGECARCCGNGQTYGPNSGEDIICPDCNGKGRVEND